ncbi:MAG: peptidoglycan DD-metalloendopeptidase family protein, partial [Halomonas sp.]|nr:peptidoglycan DD-metalloendopeptidase family protein [Halomonas sp.]
MRKAFLVSALALGIAGCAAPPNDAPVVRDLSASRAAQGGSDTVTVQSGDTLYGIAWRQNMDFRDLARLNNISPPYRLQPGQTLRLSADAPAAPTAPSGQGVTVASAGTAASPPTNGNPDWLAPDTQAIARNRTLTSRPLGASPAGASDSVTQADTSAQTAAATAQTGATAQATSQAVGGDGPGPVYDYASPGADGNLSARDRAEREALASQRSVAQSSPAGTAGTAAATTAATGVASAPATATQSASTATSASAASGNPAGAGASGTRNADAGTAVAGETETSQAKRESYTPVKDIDWQWPTDGQVVSRFGDNANITAGIDIAGQKGQPVKAAGPGIVVYAGNGVRGYGNLILLKHNDRYLSAYAHNDSLTVKENGVVD